MWMLFLVTIAFAVLTQLFIPTQKAKAGTFSDFDFPQIEDGTPIFYVAGRVRLNGPNLLWYGDFSSRPIKKKSGLFNTSTVGYKYSLGFHLGLCLGDGVRLRKIYFGGDDPAWIANGSGAGPSYAIEVWKDSLYRDASLGFNAAVPNLNDIGLNDGVSSLKTNGPWEIFKDADYSGESMVVNGDYPNLAGTPFQDSISSMRPLGGVVAPEADFEGVGESIGVRMNNPDAFGGEDSGGGFDITFDFYEGNTTQTFNAYLVEKAQTADNFISGFRGLSYLVMRGYIGNTTQLQNVSAEIERVPDPLELGVKAKVGSEGDVNPANVLYELLTKNFAALSVNPESLNVASFVAAGNTFYDEDEGISISAGGSSAAISGTFQDILKQVDATMYEDPIDGQVYLKLIRDDYVLADLPVLDQSNIEQVSSYAINLWADTKNKIRVSYEDRTKNYETRVAVAEDMANVAFQGSQSKPVNTDHKYVKRSAHANRIAARELTIYSTPLANIRLASMQFDLNLRPGSPVLLNYPEYNISNLVVRVTKADLGDLENNRLLLDLTGDKFSKTEVIYGAPADSGFTPPSLAVADIERAVFQESPRWFNSRQTEVVFADSPRVMVLPVAANTAQIAYSVFAKDTFEQYSAIITRIGYPLYATTQVQYPASYLFDTATGIELAFISEPEELLSATADQIRTTGDNLIQINDEIIGFESFILNGSGRYVLRGVHRGLLDTVPALHPAGSHVYWMGVENVGSREFFMNSTVTLSLASISPSGSREATTGVVVSFPGELP